MTSLRHRVQSFLRVESLGDAAFKTLTGAVALGLIGLFLWVVGILLREAMPAVRTFGFAFVWSQAWDPPGQVFGALVYMVGTLSSSFLALVLAIPVAVGTAIALAEIVEKRFGAILGMLVELLAAVPSIVYGIWGFYTIVPVVKRLGGEENTFGPSVLAAGIVLAIMILPIITSISRDMLRAVPRTQREAALALGLTRWEVTSRVVLPHARGGILAAVILGLGRAIGETMAVIMVIGNQPLIPKSIFDPASAIAPVIANEFGDPSGPLHFAALVELGLLLLLMSLVLNLIARAIVRATTRRLEGR